jgi:hypothetical protein
MWEDVGMMSDINQDYFPQITPYNLLISAANKAAYAQLIIEVGTNAFATYAAVYKVCKSAS